MADSAHSPELGRPRIRRLQGAPMLPILLGPRFKASRPQLQGAPPAHMPSNLGRGSLGVWVKPGLCRGSRMHELGLGIIISTAIPAPTYQALTA